MRLLLVAVSFAALSLGSYWALTRGPFGPGGSGVEGIATGVASGMDAVSGAVAGPIARQAEEPEFDGGMAVFTRLTRQAYAVTGTTADDVLASLLEKGPRDGGDVFFGITDTELDVHYDPADISGGCVIRDTRVYLDVTITLPEWAPPAGADSETVAEWGRFIRALQSHEDQHRQIAVDGAERAYRAVADLYRPSCQAAVEEARRRLERIGVEIKSAHRRFDAATDHGKTDGAAWPPRD